MHSGGCRILHRRRRGEICRVGLDAAPGLSMAGEPDSAGAMLEDVLRAILASEHRHGGAAPALAVMAYEENGEIKFIVLRSGAEAVQEDAAPLAGEALQEAQEVAGRNGGRVWVEPEESA